MPSVLFDPIRKELALRLDPLPGQEPEETFLLLGSLLKSYPQSRLQELGKAIVTELKRHKAGKAVLRAEPPEQTAGLGEKLQLFFNLAMARRGKV